MFVRFGTLLIGLTLIAGQRYFPDFTIMWFASPDTRFALWRQILIVGLITSLIVKPYFDNPYLHIVWGFAGIALWWGGVDYFINNPAYIFDAMLIVATGICFAIDALQKIPVEVPRDAQHTVILGEWLRDFAHLRNYLHPSEGFISTYHSAIRDDSHILIIH